MSFTKVKPIPTAEEIIQAHPLPEEALLGIAEHRKEVKDILAGRDKRLLLVIGPCSAWPSDAVLEYARRLAKINEEVKDKLKLVLRVYIQKPRTTKGWTGPVNQPDPLLPSDVAAGAMYCRAMMVEAIKMGLPIADEALFTHNAKGFMELLSWVAVGARSGEDQEHRIFASAVDCPVGMKNPTSGSLVIATNNIIAAQYHHTAVFDGYQVETTGNPYAHMVLRGGLEGPNYDSASIKEATRIMQEKNVSNPAIIVDASHDNCRVNGVKSLEKQEQVVYDVLEAMQQDKELNLVKGFMIESFLKPGNQKVDLDNPDALDRDGLSITDPCLGWEQTEAMLRKLAKKHIM